MKTCFKCHKEKELVEFYVHHRMADGHLNKCKDCAKKDVIQYRNANIEKIQAYDKKRNDLPHRVKQRNLYTKEHAEHKRLYAKLYYKLHRDKRDAYIKANADEIKLRKRRYRKKYAAKIMVQNRKRLALKMSVRHEDYVDNYIFERDGWICGICGRKINRRLKNPNPFSVSIDHIIPLSKGGDDSPTNVQAAHLRCNMSKNNKIIYKCKLYG